VSVTEAKLDLTFPCPNNPSPGLTTVYTTNASKNFTGFNVGAGIDWAITPNVIARLEYIFDDYGSPTITTAKWDWNDRKLTDYYDNTVRVALAFKF
jgi:opacity protein-like surface antigen